ncbi:hypothetical protein LINPERHAP2_LOCUS43676 [Linum perenne]
MMLGQGRKFCSKLAIDCTIGRQRTPVKDSTKHLVRSSCWLHFKSQSFFAIPFKPYLTLSKRFLISSELSQEESADVLFRQVCTTTPFLLLKLLSNPLTLTLFCEHASSGEEPKTMGLNQT